MRLSRWQVVAVGAIVLVSGLAYAVFGSSTEVDRSDLSRLALHTINLPDIERAPYIANAPAISSVPSRILIEESKTDPDATGAYAVGWKTKKGSGDVDLLVELLPTASTAKQARTALQQEYENKKDYSAAGLTLVGPISIPQVDGAFAAAFTEPASSTNAAPGSLGVAVFQLHHATVLVQVLGVASSDLEPDIRTLATSEARLLGHEEPGFSMTQSSYRVSTGLWVALGAAGAIVVVALAAPAIRHRRARRERRLQRAERERQRHVSGRGSNVLRRGRARAHTVPHRAPLFARRRIRARR